jgi:hypothetical protein
VVWWGADEGNTGLGAAEIGDVRRDLLARQLTTLSRLGTLFVCSKKEGFPGGVRGAFKPTSSQVMHHPLRATFDKKLTHIMRHPQCITRLCNLDLQLVCIHQKLGSNTKTAACNLLDLTGGGITVGETPQVREGGRRTRAISITQGSPADWVLTTLTTVALATNAVDSNGNGLVCLRRQVVLLLSYQLVLFLCVTDVFIGGSVLLIPVTSSSDCHTNCPGKNNSINSDAPHG